MAAGRAGGATAGLPTLLVLALAGCAVPPAGSQDALDALTERVGAVAGVDSVTSSLNQADIKDRPDEWIAFVEIGAGGSDLGIASAVQAALGAGVVGADLGVSLSVGAGEGLAPVHLDPRREADVALADDLRSLPFVDRVDLLTGRTASLTEDADLADAVPVVRPLAPLPNERGALALSTGTSLIGVDGTRPGAALLSRLDELDDDPGTEEVRTGVGALGALRASIDVVAEDPAAVAALLASTPDEAAEAGTHPRTAFAVSTPGYGETARGPQGPFDAIVAQWTDAGFEQVDRTMGRDYWASKARREDSVAAVSIRGTQEGLSLTATAECVPQ